MVLKSLFTSHISSKALGELSDEELLTLYKVDKRKTILSIFFKRYGHIVLGCALKLTSNKQMAEDIMMDIFCELPDLILKHDILNFKGWLFTITKNRCFFILKSENKYSTLSDTEGLIELTENPSGKYEKEKLYIQVERAIHQLNPIQRDCIRLFYYDKLSYDEISIKQNITLKQVKSALQNGKRNISLIISQL